MAMKEFLRQGMHGLTSRLFHKARGLVAIQDYAAKFAVLDLRQISLEERVVVMRTFEDEALAAFLAKSFVLPFTDQWVIHDDRYIDHYGGPANGDIMQLCYERGATGIWRGPESMYTVHSTDGSVVVADYAIPEAGHRFPFYDYKSAKATPARAMLALTYYLSLPKSHTIVTNPIAKATNQLRRGRGLPPLQPVRVVHLHPLPTRVYQPMDTVRAAPTGHEVRGHMRRYAQRDGSIILRPVKAHSRCGGSNKPHIITNA